MEINKVDEFERNAEEVAENEIPLNSMLVIAFRREMKFFSIALNISCSIRRGGIKNAF